MEDFDLMIIESRLNNHKRESEKRIIFPVPMIRFPI